MIDSRQFRSALGQFATGVTVITTLAEDGSPVGVTASSFNSVSLDPPMVLWSLARSSGSLPAFQQRGHFCVHVLSAAQETVSQQFATPGADKFAGVSWSKGVADIPLLSEFAAQFQCKTAYEYEGGDHIIFVGEVLEFETRDSAPLVFHGGRYALARSKTVSERPGDGVDLNRGQISDEFFLYLLSRAHFQAQRPLHEAWVAAGIDHTGYLCLTLLGIAGPLTWQELGQRLQHTGHEPNHDDIARLLELALLRETPDGHRFELTVKGRNLHFQLLAQSKAIEEHLLQEFDDVDVEDARRFLRRFITVSADGVPDIFATTNADE